MDQPDEKLLNKLYNNYLFETPSTSFEVLTTPHNVDSLQFESLRIEKFNLRDRRYCSKNPLTTYVNEGLNNIEDDPDKCICCSLKPIICNEIRNSELSDFNFEFEKLYTLKQNEIDENVPRRERNYICHKFCNSYYTVLLLMLTLFDSALATLLDTSVSCDQTNFVLSLNFDVPFRGIVYSEEGFPNCVYVNGTMLSHSSYQLKIPLIGCETRINEDGNFENAIIVQENSAFLQSTDKKYLLTCIPSTPLVTRPPATLASFSVVSTTPGTPNKENITPSNMLDEDLTSSAMAMASSESMITVDFGGVTVDNAQSEVIGGVMSPPAVDGIGSSLKYAVEIRNGHRLDAPSLNAALNIGDPISYMVRLQKPVADSQVGRCWASDSKSNLELSDERGCTLQPRGNIWGAFERVENAREVIFVNRIKAWAFPTSNEVNIFCNLRICMSRVCAFGNCTAINLPSTEPTPINEENNQQKFFDPHSDSSQIGQTQPEMEGEEDNEKVSDFFRNRGRRQHDTNLGPENAFVPVKTAAIMDSGQMPALPGLIPVHWSQDTKSKSSILLHNSERLLRGHPIVPVNQHPSEISLRMEEIISDRIATPILRGLQIRPLHSGEHLDTLLPVRPINKLPRAESRIARQNAANNAPKKAIHIGGLMGELTEVETLATQLRFRRQSIQRARISPMKLVTADEMESKDEDATQSPSVISPAFTVKDNNNGKYIENNSDFYNATLGQHHYRDPFPNVSAPLNIDFGDNSFAQGEDEEEKDAAVWPRPPSGGAFSPKPWRVAVACAFLALFAAALVAFFVLWHKKSPRLVEAIKFFRYPQSRN